MLDGKGATSWLKVRKMPGTSDITHALSPHHPVIIGTSQNLGKMFCLFQPNQSADHYSQLVNFVVLNESYNFHALNNFFAIIHNFSVIF
jgi:hypothetical protein